MNLMEAYKVSKTLSLMFLAITMLGFVIDNPILQYMIIVSAVSFIIQMIVYLKILGKL